MLYSDKPKLKLSELIDSKNIAELLDDAQKADLVEKVIDGFLVDEQSRSEWKDTADKILDLAKLKPEQKDTPQVNSANVKFPIIPTAILNYAARVYPELVKDGHVAAVASFGNDPTGELQAKAERISNHMDYQMLTESDSWETNMDRLLHAYAAVGMAYKKVYFDPIKKRNEAILCLHDEIVINDNIPSLEDAPRITHNRKLRTKDILSNIRAGLFDVSDEDWERIRDSLSNDDANANDFHDILEQHRWDDLDGDDMEEPYIAIVHKECNILLRVVPRYRHDSITFNTKGEVQCIEADNYFQDYHCIPRFDGKFHSIGLGTLLLHPNEAINTMYNQLIDSAKFNNLQGGIYDGSLELPAGETKLKMGQMTPVKNVSQMPLTQQVMMYEFKEPSQTMFALLQLTIEASKELGSFTNVLTGNEQAQNVTATTIMTLAEEGRKSFTAMQRRFYRCFKGELDKWFKLNKLYMEPRVQYSNSSGPQIAMQSDYMDEAMDIRPVVDPNMSSESQQIMKAQAIYQMFCQDPTSTPKQRMTAQQDLLQALKVQNPQRFADQPAPPPPNPQILAVQLDAQKHQDDIQQKEKDRQLKVIELQAKVPEIQANISKTKAASVHQLASAAALSDKVDLEKDKLNLEHKKIGADLAKHVMDHTVDVAKEMNRAEEAKQKPHEETRD